MRTPKLYIGKTVRTLRADSGATQAEFAARLGLSTSYLNQIENNQRPVSASVLMTLAERCQVDLRAIGAGEDDRLISALAETLADPLFESYQAGLQELKLVAQNAPGIARALILAHNAYRRATEQLAGMDSRAESLGGLVEPGPYEEVRDFFHFVDNYLQALDVVAEKLAGELDLPEADPGAALTEYLETVKRVRVTRAEGFDAPLRRFDAHSNVLFLNPGLPIPSRNFQLAYQIGVLDHQPLIDKIAASADFRTPDATEICKIGLANYYAGALLLPYAAFREFGARASPRSRVAGDALPGQSGTGRSPSFDLAASGRKGHPGVLRPLRPRRQHHQAPQRRQTAICALWRRLPVMERSPGF